MVWRTVDTQFHYHKSFQSIIFRLKLERRVYCLFPYLYHTPQIILQGHAQGKNCKKTSAVSVQG